MSKNQYAERLRQQERVYLKRVADYSSLESIPEIWPLAAQRFGSIIALQDPHAVGAHGAPASTLTYTQLH
ncbi:MAG: long-chain fatty acid--CoA ligase, partial [Moorea sp. SIO4A3]|nr:long-chain fatty acid--CoA ligase [Moorena sp. SIO4A3]